MLTRVLRFLGSTAIRLLGLLLDVARAFYDEHKEASDTRELDRQQRDQVQQRRQSDAERAALGAEADVTAAVKEREAIHVATPTTDEEGEQLAARLGRKLQR